MQPDHECCECVPRLRKQNKDSSDAWTRRIGRTESDLAGLRHLMGEAVALNRGMIGLSAYGQASLAAALSRADELHRELQIWKEEAHRQRRAKEAAEEKALKLHTMISNPPRSPDDPVPDASAA